MKFGYSCIGLILLSLYFGSPSRANATHTASVDIDLIQVDAKGKEHNLDSRSGDFSLDWNSKKCEIQLKKQQFVYCTLDTSQDLSNSKNELVMKAIPQSHFDSTTLDALIRTLGYEDRHSKKIIDQVVNETSADRAKGFDLPFYTCGDCEKNGKELELYSAYQSYVSRDLPIENRFLGDSHLILRMKLSGMKAVKGAFNIIGNSNAASYGH